EQAPRFLLTAQRQRLHNRKRCCLVPGNHPGWNGMTTMARFIHGTLALVLVLLAGCDPLAPLDFKEFSVAEGGFSIQMPGHPERETQQVQGLPTVGYVTPIRNGCYAIAFSDIPSG